MTEKRKIMTIGASLRQEVTEDLGWTYNRFGVDERVPFKDTPSATIFDAKQMSDVGKANNKLP